MPGVTARILLAVVAVTGFLATSPVHADGVKRALGLDLPQCEKCRAHHRTCTDGSFATLVEVVDFYDRGGAPNPGLDQDLRPLKLTVRDKEDLVAFLKSLTGKTWDAE